MFHSISTLLHGPSATGSGLDIIQQQYQYNLQQQQQQHQNQQLFNLNRALFNNKNKPEPSKENISALKSFVFFSQY